MLLDLKRLQWWSCVFVWNVAHLLPHLVGGSGMVDLVGLCGHHQESHVLPHAVCPAAHPFYSIMCMGFVMSSLACFDMGQAGSSAGIVACLSCTTPYAAVICSCFARCLRIVKRSLSFTSTVLLVRHAVLQQQQQQRRLLQAG
jgi:hypothetical protein